MEEKEEGKCEEMMRNTISFLFCMNNSFSLKVNETLLILLQNKFISKNTS